MERLTEERQFGPWASLKDKAETIPGAFSNYDCLLAHMTAVTRLKEYEDAEADGRVVVLPCKVGQRVFALLDADQHISECEVKQIGLSDKIGFVGIEPIGNRGRQYGVSLNGFGKTVFLTRKEAEKALEAG